MDTEQPPQGHAAPQAVQGPGDEAPKFVTEEQLNKAITARFKGLEDKVQKSFGDSFSAFTEKLRTEIAALVKTPEAKPEGEKKKDGDTPGAEGPELRSLKEQVARLTKLADDARSERDTERTKSRDASLRQTLADALAHAGIEGVRARHAIGLLVDSEKRVRYADQGDAVVFRRSEHEEAPLDEGLGEWLKSDDAKLYLPPRHAGGSGDRPGGTPPRTAPAPPTRGDVAEGLRRALLGQI